MAPACLQITMGGGLASNPRIRSCLSPISSSFCSSSSSSSLQTTRLPSHGLCRSMSLFYHDSKCVVKRWSLTTKGDWRRGKSTAGAQAEAGSAAMVAKEMERVAAKEALLLSIKDAGGLKGLSEPAANAKSKIEVNEKILRLERLNPTPRPTTSPVLEGLWQFEWAGAQSPGIVAARTVLRRFPPALACISSLSLLILDGSARARGFLKIFNTIESSFTLAIKISVEGPLRLKEEYVECLFTMPTVREGSIPPQLKGMLNGIGAAVEGLPDTIKEAISSPVKFPLTGTFSRELIISYLDEEVLVARDKSGIPDVLLRLESPVTDSSSEPYIQVVPEYMS